MLKRAIRFAIELFNSWLSWSHRHQRVHVGAANRPLKANLGCGMSVAPGWVNIDGSLNALVSTLPRWTYRLAYRVSGSRLYYAEDLYVCVLQSNRFVHHNLVYGIPLDDQSADVLFCSHFLEHLEPDAAEKLLVDCRRVLRPGGVLRVVVPDLEFAWELYRRGEKRLMLHDFFFVGEDAAFSRHRYAYDFEMLSEILRRVGFGQVCRREYRQGLTPDLELLDNRQEYSLFVEAQP